VRGFEKPDSAASAASAQAHVFEDSVRIEIVVETFQRRLCNCGVHFGISVSIGDATPVREIFLKGKCREDF
jgi:hypothetical protein